MRRAAVSAFALSGTNAHVVLEEAPADPGNAVPAPTPAADQPTVAWVISAKSREALTAQAGRLSAHLRAEKDVTAADVAVSLAQRSVYAHRAVLVGSDRDELTDELTALATGTPGPVRGVVRGGGAVVLVFPGQGSQWVGMGARLCGESAVFAEQMQLCGEALGGWVDWSLMDVVRGVAGAPGLDRVDVVQPVLWAVMVSGAVVVGGGGCWWGDWAFAG